MREPLLGGVAAVDDRVDGGLDVVGLGLGEEADVAEVDAQQRGAALAGQLGGAQDRAVAADDDDQLAALGRGVAASARPRSRRRAVERRGRRPPPPSSRSDDAVLGERPAERPRDVAAPRARPVWASTRTRRRRRVGSSAGHGSTLSPAAPRSAVRRSPRRRSRRVADHRGARAAASRKNSTLPDGPGSGLAVTAAAPQPRAGRGVGDRGARPRRAAPGRGPRRPCRPGPCRPRTAA